MYGVDSDYLNWLVFEYDVIDKFKLPNRLIWHLNRLIYSIAMFSECIRIIDNYLVEVRLRTVLITHKGSTVKPRMLLLR